MSGKPFEEAVKGLERNALRLVDKQGTEDRSGKEIMKNLGRSDSPMASFEVRIVFENEVDSQISLVASSGDGILQSI